MLRDAPLRVAVRAVQERHARALAEQLEEFISRHDYRRAGEGFGELADVWVRAVRFVVGEIP